MKQIILRRTTFPVVVIFLFLFNLQLGAQSPGTIVKPMNGNGTTILNPNGDRYASKTSAGFVSNDLSESEIPFKVVPPMIEEGGTDNANGASGGFTDIVTAADKSGFYAYFDGTNVLYRLRMGGTNNGAKSYSVLLDTDLKFGNTGQYADPNYLAPGVGTPNGNPGFEYEIVFSSQFHVTVYNIDGRTSGVVVATYPLNTHSQISVALSAHGGDADYFYDWGVPATAIGSPSLIRFVASAQISPHPALTGQVSDIFGIDDRTISSTADAWTKIINAQCGFALTALNGTSALCATCTNAPTINPVTVTGSNVPVTGNWVSLHPTKPNTATISLYRNGTLVGTTTATSGMGWSIPVSTVYSNDVFTAKAKAADESECLFSPPILGGCTTPPAAPVISCAGWKGIEGNIPSGAEVIIYEITGTGRNLLTAGLIYTDNASDRKFDFHATTGQSGVACQGNVNDVKSGTYEIITNLNGCYSKPTFICITGNNSFSSLASNNIVLNTPILNRDTSISGSGAVAGQVLSLYRNGYFLASQTAATTTFVFSNLTLFQNDELRVYAQTTASGSCMTMSNAYTVTCFTTAPAIEANAQGEVLSSSTSISGTAPDAGATIRLFKGTPSAHTLVATTTVGMDKTWSVSGLTLVPGDTYYATCTLLCESAASRIVIVKGPTTVCPTITGTYTEKSTLVTGTLPFSFSGKIRLYLDGALIDSTEITGATSWSIGVNTSGYNKLYAYGVLRATAEGVNLAEGPSCSAVSIQCVPPATPDVTPESINIFAGQSASFTVSNAADSLLYSIWDNNGNNYASSVFGSGNSSLLVPSYTFNKAGTYNLLVIADKLTGSSCYSSRPVTVVVENVTLATGFISLSAKREGRQVQVNWRVSGEEGVRHYKVERSLNGLNFVPVATVLPGTGSRFLQSYSATDDLSTGMSKIYYRIRLVNENASPVYSQVVSLSGESEKAIQILPNPVKDKAVVLIQSSEKQMATAELLDVTGRVLTVKKVQFVEGTNRVTLDGLEQYKSGHYLLRVVTKSGTQHEKLVKQ